MKSEIKTVDEYIAQFDEVTKKRMEIIRSAIVEAAPNSVESIAWGMPSYSENGFICHFANAKHHIGFYSSPEALEFYKDEIGDIPTNLKNTMRLMNDREIPVELIKKIVMFRVEEKRLHASSKARPNTKNDKKE